MAGQQVSNRHKRQLDVIETFIKEEGQATGTVSGQMALNALGLIAEWLIEWKYEKPSQPGIYIYRDEREWVHRLVFVQHGSWQLARNPEWLYANDEPLSKLATGWWFGPIPIAPDSTFSLR